MTAFTADDYLFMAQALRLAHDTLDIEAAAVLGLKRRLGDDFARAVALMLDVAGRVVVMGMGKSGHVGRKIAEGRPRELIAEHLEPEVVEVYGQGALQLAESALAARAGSANRGTCSIAFMSRTLCRCFWPP